MRVREPVPLCYDFVMTKTHAASKSAEAAEAEVRDGYI